MIDFGLDQKRAIVAGAGHRPPRPGLGRAISLTLAEAGVKVACVDLSLDRAAETAAAVADAGGEAIALAADLRDRHECSQVVAHTVKAFGGVDILVDVIGEARWGQVVNTSEDDWDWTMATNLRQAFLIFQAAAKQMLQQGNGGALVAISSVDAFRSAYLHGAYGVAKAGLVSLTKTLSQELGPDGIRVNTVAPGLIWVPPENDPDQLAPPEQATPLARPIAQDIANAAVFLASDLAGAITGQSLAVDGGALVQWLWELPPERLDFLISESERLIETDTTG